MAPTDATVLVLGETGTGKELVAQELHRHSRRRFKPLIRVNCACIPKELYESEFFGHAKGAFTGAVKDRVGRFEAAGGGTLFLDEIGEIPVELQSKLLRVLQEKCYERVGEERTRQADVRIIAATNRDLKKEVAAGRRPILIATLLSQSLTWCTNYQLCLLSEQVLLFYRWSSLSVDLRLFLIC